jgi:hypothetical protein
MEESAREAESVAPGSGVERSEEPRTGWDTEEGRWEYRLDRRVRAS